MFGAPHGPGSPYEASNEDFVGKAVPSTHPLLSQTCQISLRVSVSFAGLIQTQIHHRKEHARLAREYPIGNGPSTA